MRFNYFLVIIILMSFVVSSQPPFQTSDASGLIVEVPVIEFIKQNNDFDFHAHVFDSTSGKPLTNATVDCYLHLYNGTNGKHFIQTKMGFSSNLIDFDYNVLGGNFTEVGQYAAIVYCNTTTIGGFIEYPFYVSYSGDELTFPQSVLYSSFLGLLVLSFFLLIFAINKLPDSNDYDDEDGILQINYIKYLRTPLWITVYFLVIAISFISSNIAYGYLNEILVGKFLFMIFVVLLSLSPLVIIFLLINLFVKIINDNEMRTLLRGGFMKEQL